MNLKEVRDWAKANDCQMTHIQQTKEWLEFNVCCVGHAIQLQNVLNAKGVDYGHDGIHFFIKHVVSVIKWDLIQETFNQADLFTLHCKVGADEWLEVCDPNNLVDDAEIKKILTSIHMEEFISITIVEGTYVDYIRLGAI